MVAMTLYPSKRRSPSATKREARVLIHLRDLLDQLQDMTPAERDEASQTQWIPPVRVVEKLLDPSLRQHERVEIIIGAHKTDCGGQSPTWDTIAGVLGISQKV